MSVDNTRVSGAYTGEQGRDTGVAGTLQVDRCSGSDCSRPLSADGVVPQCRSRDDGRDVGQTDDEIG